MIKTIFWMLAFSLVTVNVNADPVVGIGTAPCSSWVDARLNKQAQSDEEFIVEMMIISWVQGFLSGGNTQRSGVLDGKESNEMFELPDSGELSSLLDDYCKRNQLETIYGVSINIFLTVRGRQ